LREKASRSEEDPHGALCGERGTEKRTRRAIMKDKRGIAASWLDRCSIELVLFFRGAAKGGKLG